MSRASPEGTATFRLWCGNCVVFIERSELVWFPSTSWTLNERHLKAGELRDLSKHGKCFPNNSRPAAKPSWALSACSWRRLFVHCCCPDPLGDIPQVGRAHTWGLSGPTTDLLFQSETTAWSSSCVRCVQFLHKSQACKAGGALWCGLGLENPQLRGHLGGDCKKGVPQSVSSDCGPSQAWWGGVGREDAHWRVGFDDLARAIKIKNKF